MSKASVGRRLARAALFSAVGVALSVSGAAALDTVRLGKSVPHPFSMTMPDVGMEAGIFQKHGVTLEISSYGGDARMQQALTSDAIDIGLGSGPGMAFMAKGVPAKGVAAYAGAPLTMGVVISYDSPLRTAADLKGKRLGVTTAGSLTDWLTRELSRNQGFDGADTITPVALGRLPGMVAALKTGQIDGFVISIAVGYAMEEKQEGRVLLKFGDTIKDFHNHIIFATNKMQQDRADVLRRFLKGWFETVAFMKANKGEAVRISRTVTQLPESVAVREYDETIDMLSDDGLFNPRALEVLVKSFVELGVLEQEPDPKTLYTEEFLPAKAM